MDIIQEVYGKFNLKLQYHKKNNPNEVFLHETADICMSLFRQIRTQEKQIREMKEELGFLKDEITYLKNENKMTRK